MWHHRELHWRKQRASRQTIFQANNNLLRSYHYTDEYYCNLHPYSNHRNFHRRLDSNRYDKATNNSYCCRIFIRRNLGLFTGADPRTRPLKTSSLYLNWN